ncbi:H-2 class I histocompatibility antigen, Q10 alpha chain-like isoform X2 [Colossoma macropomum]|uniref:H-2 class I histocompatibility antigen, Q10 alpha chain-like isoform X2 n=1 Tax=Colossoma macropomum TaxID=42526 RepID=UPI0018650071|nr:H-2 class I histocompatibility antigen, Q10 alpha chain-like isoform X2 [Colossoma macropomum]
MDHCTPVLKYLLLLSVNIYLTSAASHSLHYFYIGVTSGVNFPEFTIVGLVDGEQIVYYDSNIRKMIQRNEWIKKIEADDPEHWNRETQKSQDNQKSFKFNVDVLMKRFNHTEGVHTVQLMYGCELHHDGTTRGYRQYSYDGEDFLSLDLNTVTWTAASPKALITKYKWERAGAAGFHTAYLQNECISWLKKYVEYGRSTLKRKVSPEVSLFQKDSSSPVVCHATGFYPKAMMISWQKNGEDLHEDVELREMLPNQDGTFQKRSVLIVSPEELNKHHYTCIIQHSSLDKKMVLPVTERRVLQDGDMVGAIVGAVVFVLLLAFIGSVGLFFWKKKKNQKSGFRPVSPGSVESDRGSSSTISSTASE